jgi:protein required for attachment to host cells
MKRDEYIVIAESAFAKVFKTGPHQDELTLLKAFENPEGRKQRRELDADRQGMNKTVVAGYHGMSGEENSHEHDVENFAREVCEFLRKEHVAGKFSHLHIAAAPHLLGVIRKQLSEDCVKALGDTVNKNLIHASEREILAQFA